MRLSPARRFLLAPLLAVALFGLSACGDDSSDDGEVRGADDGSGEEAAEVPPPPDDAVDLTGESAVTVEVGDNKYTERAIVVAPGTEVTFENVGLNRHDVVSSDGAFEDVPIEELDDGGAVSRTFDEPGDYAYYCSIHGTIDNGQRGWVTVADA